MTLSELILLSLFTISIFLLVAVLIFFKFYRKYTREKFAFRVFLLISSLTGTLIALLISGKSTFQLTTSMFGSLIGFDTTAYDPTISDKFLAVILILALIYLAINLHRNWPGAISTREHDAELIGLAPSLIGGTIAAIADIAGKASLQTFTANRGSLPQIEMSPLPSENKAWHSWAVRILQLTSSQFRIDEIKDWYSEKQLFISCYGPRNGIIGVLCSHVEPSPECIRDSIDFITKQVGRPVRLIVAIEIGAQPRRSDSQLGMDIEFRFRDEMLDSLVDFSTYKADIEFRYEHAEIAEGYSLKIPDVYVPSSGQVWIDQNKLNIPDVEEYVVAWTAQNNLKHLAVLGEYGQGKSVLALRLTYRLLFVEKGFRRIPLLITLGGRSPRTQSKLGILADWAAAYDLNPKAILTLHDAGRVLLIFDGFDEMDLVGDASIRLDHFRTLWEFSRERHAKILITGRPNFFLDQLERERSLNIRPDSIDVPYTVPIYLSPFSVPQIEKALRGFDRSVRTEITDSIKSASVSNSFRDLVSRPSTLFLAANIWGELRSVEHPDQIRSAEVIDRFIAHSYERQQRKYLRSFLSVNEREYFTVGVAIAMLNETHYSNRISKEKFQQAIARLLDKFPDELSRYEPATGVALVSLKTRLQDREMLTETISTDVRSCGILVADLSQVDNFKFAHKSFFEFLIASNIIHTIIKKPICKELILHHAARAASGNDQFARNAALDTIWGGPAGMNDEMVQFAGEILYHLSGAKMGMNQSEIELRLGALGLPVARLAHAAYAMQKSTGLFRFGGISAYYIVIRSKNLPTRILSIMAAFFRVHGIGGAAFVEYERARKAKWDALFKRFQERHEIELKKG